MTSELHVLLYLGVQYKKEALRSSFDQFERSIALAVLAKVTGKLKHQQHSFEAFPLVEDLDAPEPDIEAVDYINPRMPFHSPSQSPTATPLSSARFPLLLVLLS